jgi:hypothetical protein
MNETLEAVQPKITQVKQFKPYSPRVHERNSLSSTVQEYMNEIVLAVKPNITQAKLFKPYRPRVHIVTCFATDDAVRIVNWFV